MNLKSETWNLKSEIKINKIMVFILNALLEWADLSLCSLFYSLTLPHLPTLMATALSLFSIFHHFLTFLHASAQCFVLSFSLHIEYLCTYGWFMHLSWGESQKSTYNSIFLKRAFKTYSKPLNLESGISLSELESVIVKGVGMGGE